MTRRRWIAEQWDEATATISGAQAEHMARVLRATAGMEADVVAGGHVFHAEVAAVSADEIRFNLIAEVQADPALPVTLVMAVLAIPFALATGKRSGVTGFALAILLAVGATLLAGLYPTWRAARVQPAWQLKAK